MGITKHLKIKPVGDTNAFSGIAVNIMEKGEFFHPKRAPLLPAAITILSGFPISKFKEMDSYKEKIDFVKNRLKYTFPIFVILIKILTIIISLNFLRRYVTENKKTLILLTIILFFTNPFIATAKIMNWDFAYMALAGCFFIITFRYIVEKSTPLFIQYAVLSTAVTLLISEAFPLALAVHIFVAAVTYKKFIKNILVFALILPVPIIYGNMNEKMFGGGFNSYSMSSNQSFGYVYYTDLPEKYGDEKAKEFISELKKYGIYDKLKDLKFQLKNTPYFLTEKTGKPIGYYYNLFDKTYKKIHFKFMFNDPAGYLKTFFRQMGFSWNKYYSTGFVNFPKPIRWIMDKFSDGIEISVRFLMLFCPFIMLYIFIKYPQQRKAMIIMIPFILLINARLFALHPVIETLLFHLERFLIRMHMVSMFIVIILFSILKGNFNLKESS